MSNDQKSAGTIDSSGPPSRWSKWGSCSIPYGGPVSKESAEYTQGLTLRPTDVVIMTFPKTGTTWMQNICEQLRTKAAGYDHFSEITEVQPWLERMCGVGQTLEDSPGPIRCFKSHLTPSSVVLGGKYLTICRDPKDVLLSLFAFLAPKRPEIEACGDANGMIARESMLKFPHATIWEYYIELWEVRNEPNVLLLSYENLKNDSPDLSNHLPLIAKFLGVTFSSEEEEKALYPRVAKLVSQEAMKKNENKFDDNFIRRRELERGLGQKAEVVTTKVNTHGAKKPTINEKSIGLLQQYWKENVTPVTGHETYEDFAKDVAALLEQKAAAM